MQSVFYKEGDIGGYAIQQEKSANTVLKIDKITIPHLDPFKIGHTYLKLNQYSMFISLKHVCAIFWLFSIASSTVTFNQNHGFLANL